MRSHTMQILITLGLLLMSAITVHANDPDPDTPWPVGSTDSLMNFTKTLMTSYGDPVNGWGEFHAGIDIDANTESPSCDEVRSVIDGDVVISNMYRFYADSAYQWIVITTEGTDRGRGFRDGCI
ncbi:MAG: M23 family metallopeptidase, partial [Candidatus Aegiribacteria sp.]|nr:M23 family metallopeptidase [Candidatus Aegiribacteria sp.]